MGIYIFGSGGGGGTSGTDTSNDTIEGKYVLNPYTFHDKNGNAGTGLIYNWDGTILAGGSTDGNKVTIQPSQSTRHIAAGSYINREIELAAMPAGSVALSQSGNKVTATRTAGYVSAGLQDFTIGAGSTSLSRSGATVILTREAGYVNTGTDQLTVPLYSHTENVTVNGSKTITPAEGTAGFSSVTINTSVAGSTPALQNRSVTITQNGLQYVYPTGTYNGLASIAMTTGVPQPTPTTQDVYFDGNTSLAISGTSVSITGKSTLQMVSLVRRASTSNLSTIVAVIAWRTSNTCYYYVSNGGMGSGTASWTSNGVTLNLSNSSSWYLTDNYRLTYAYLA